MDGRPNVAGWHRGTRNRILRAVPLALLCAGWVAACGSDSPSRPSAVTTTVANTTVAASSTTTSVAPVTGRRYVGTYGSRSLDLSLFLSQSSTSSLVIGPRALFQVTGGYNTGTGSGAFSGSITGTL